MRKERREKDGWKMRYGRRDESRKEEGMVLWMEKVIKQKGQAKQDNNEIIEEYSQTSMEEVKHGGSEE